MTAVRDRDQRALSVIDDRLWTVTDLAQFFGLHPKTLYGWVERDYIPHYKIGGRVRFDPAEIMRWLNGQRGGL